MKRIIFAISFFTLFHVLEEVNAQNVNLNTEAKTLTYEELYDTPYDINKLFIHLQPMYGELFTTNSTVGWGIKAQYYLKNLADFEGHIRAPYGRSFDLTRDAAFKNSTVDNEARPFTYFELIGTYHIKDEEQDTETKFILYSKRYKGDKWAATVPSHTIIPTKVRRIYGARFGGMAYKSSVDYNRIMDKQGVTLISDEGGEIGADESVYGNMSAVGFYIGGSMVLIKNVAVQPDKIYGTLVNDLIFTTFFDVNFTPMVTVDDIYIDGIRYSSEPILKSVLGFRAGLEGKFNRKFSWAYGGEIGYRPGLKQSGFFALIKISFPVFSTQLRYQVESFGK
ncbi:MAG: hypothetical protein KAI29_07805 [Cyclobacteriaceae bacterium]|nr:hypothetical protein [Cyclobacteriaceae bacterium]